MRFSSGLRQPLIAVRLAIRADEQLPLAAMDRWIAEALEADIGDYTLVCANGVSPDAPAVRYARRLLYVATILLQDLRVPVFERAVVNGVGRAVHEPGTATIDIGFPTVEILPPSLVHATLGVAHDLLGKLVQGPHAPAELESAYREMQEKFVAVWSRLVPGGKSTVPVLQAAFELGIPISHCGTGRYVLGWGSQSRLFYRSSIGSDGAIGASSTQNKHVAIQMMKRAGIPVPRGLLAESRNLSFSSVSHLTLPLVVKPVDRDRGEGVTVGVVDAQGFNAAVESAFRLSKGVRVEEQVSGTCHRILIIDGEAAYVVRRNPRSLTGDGIHTIRALAARENATIRKKIPLKRLPEYELDETAAACLAKLDMDFESIPGAGQRVPLRDVQSTLWGGDPEVVTDALHPDNLEIAARAARLFGLDCAGVDFISDDISVPWHVNGAAINEVNYSPVIGRTHAYQRHGIRVYLKRAFPQLGRIPIEVFVGAGMLAAASARQQEFVMRGERCFLFAGRVVDHQGRPLHFADASTPADAIGMLRTDRNMDALVVHLGDHSDMLEKGFPFEYVSRLVSDVPDKLGRDQARVVDQLRAYLPAGSELEHAAP